MSHPRSCNAAHSFSCERPCASRNLRKFPPIFRSRLIFCSILFSRIDQYWLQFFSLYAILNQRIDRYTGQYVGEIKMTCTFFGHRDCPLETAASLRAAIEDLIVRQHVSVFYVGNQGAFDRLAISALTFMKNKYPYISCYVVLAYMPLGRREPDTVLPTLFPDGIEKAPKRFAICYRNDWMLSHADIVVTYIRRHGGGAAHYAEKAEQQGKVIIHL